MRNKKEKYRFSAGSQQSSQQRGSAGNQFEEQLDRFKSIYGIEPGHGSDTELANLLGITRGAIGGWKKQGIPADRMAQARREKGVQEEWIETGEGEMYKEEHIIHEERGEYRIFTHIPPDGGLFPDSFVLIPHVEAPLGAGAREFIPDASPYELLAFRNDWISKVASSPENLILLPIKGPSMEKTMFDGDLVMVDREQKEIIRDLIYAVRIEETLTVKRVQKLPNGRYRLISDNKEFPPEEFSSEEAKIEGRVIWLARDQIK